MRIAAGEFKNRCLKLMDRVQESHDEIVITKYGRPVARLVPVGNAGDASRRPLYGYLKGSVTILGDVVAPIDESWDAQQ